MIKRSELVYKKGNKYFRKMKSRDKEVIKTKCHICNNDMFQLLQGYRKGYVPLCSKKCISIRMRNNPKLQKISGDNHPCWKGGYITKSGYKVVAGKKYFHRNVMEKMLGRKLKRTEIIHHKDLDKSNNDPENLMLFDNSGEHHKFHWECERKMLKWFKKNKPELFIKIINGENI